MKISNKLLLVLSSLTLLAGCTPAGEAGQPCPKCPECTQCETCKECEECKECPECPTPHEHTFKDTWSMDETRHWKDATCDHHDVTKDLGEHIDVDTNGKCDVCGYTFVVVPNRYTVIWENYDEKLLEVDYDVLEGSTPEYNGEEPTRLDDEDIYIFSGWSPEVTKVTGNTRYVAQYEVNTKTYKVTWEDDAGNTLKQEDIQIGHIPSFGDKDPVKESTDFVEYVFKGWDKEISRVFEDVTYKASFEVADWCVTETELLNALKRPENPNLMVDVKCYVDMPNISSGLHQIYGDLMVENVDPYGTVYLTKDGLAIYYEDGMGQWITLRDTDYFDMKYYFMFLYSELELDSLNIVCDFENQRYIFMEGDSDNNTFNTYLTFENKQIKSLKVELEQKSPHKFLPYLEYEYTWGGCEDIEIPEDVLEDAKYKVVGSVYDAARVLTEGQTMTEYDYQINKTTVISIARQPNRSYALKVDYGDQKVYFDNFYRYTEILSTETYVRFENDTIPEVIYTEQIFPEVMPNEDYVYNEELHSYVYVDIDNNTTYIVQFEFGLPVSIEVYDDINDLLLKEFVFSDYNSTTVIIPEHDWN